MNILCGICPPTNGSATIYGSPVAEIADRSEMKQLVGICPQFNIIFDVLTVEEHLRIFAAIKGIPPADIDAEVMLPSKYWFKRVCKIKIQACMIWIKCQLKKCVQQCLGDDDILLFQDIFCLTSCLKIVECMRINHFFNDQCDLLSLSVRQLILSVILLLSNRLPKCWRIWTWRRSWLLRPRI